MWGAAATLLAALARVGLWLYERAWGDAAKYRAMRDWQVRDQARTESERERLKAASELIDRAAPPADVAKGLTDAWNEKPKP